MTDVVNEPTKDKDEENPLSLELILDEPVEASMDEELPLVAEDALDFENEEVEADEAKSKRPVARVIKVPYDNFYELRAEQSAKASKAMHVTQAVIVCVLGSAVILTAAVTLLMGVMAQ